MALAEPLAAIVALGSEFEVGLVARSGLRPLRHLLAAALLCLLPVLLGAVDAHAQVGTLSPPTLDDAQQGEFYDTQIFTWAGNSGFTFSIESGDLPPGMTLDRNGRLSGTPTAAGDYSFTVLADLGLGVSGSRQYDLKVTDVTPAPTVPILGVTMTHAGDAGQGVGQFTYAITPSATAGDTSGALTASITLPSGMSFTGGAGIGWSCSGSGSSASCTSATVIAAGTNGGVIRLTVNFVGVSATSVAPSVILSGGGASTAASATDPTLVVQARLNSIPALAVGTAVSFIPISGSGGTGTYTYTIGGRSLPDGLSFDNATGRISGTPTTADVNGGFMTVAVRDTASPAGVAGQEFSLFVTAAAPTVTLVTPNSGATAGGALVTITGTNFTSATGVTIGGVAATGIFVVSPTSITATTPAHAAGTASVLVTTPGGTNAANTLYTYVAPAPTVTSVNPASGTGAGGATVTITGTNFTGTTGVTIGGVAATGIILVSPTSITATTPAHAVGVVNVAVTTPGGTGTGTGLYTYTTPAPTVTSVSPASGTTAGGTVVTITGTDFTGATSVNIGSLVTTEFTVVSPTSITVTTPAFNAGAVNIAVTTPNGIGVGIGVYTYVRPPPPTVTGISPASGTTAGGVVVTITGTNFTGATGVTIGGLAATGITVVSSTSITATTPAHSAGVADVVVTTPGGTGFGTDVYTYVLPAPTVTGISPASGIRPASGPTAGGVVVTISGTNFTGATGVTIGGVAATGITVVNPTRITATTPAHAAGVVDVAVTTPSGTGTGTGLYTYVPPAPTVTSVNPVSGTTAGGAVVTITGTDFTGATGVTIGGAAATGITVVSPTSITATTPAHAAGTASVLVTTPGGTNAANSLYTYATPAPTVTAISPNSGTTAGGTVVTITGTNLTGATSVIIGSMSATGITVVSPTSITATTPAHSAGVVNVGVTTPGGTGFGTGVYTYVTPAAPTITGISPASGTTAGGVMVTITGTNLTGATGVTIGGAAATNITVVSPTSITATTPVHSAGVADVIVTTPGGTGTGTGLYTYVTPAPTVTSVNPTSGTTVGGVMVTITGTNFTGATGVTIGGAAATGITVVSPTSITATTPAHAAGTASVLVTTPGGTNAANTLYTYATPAPTVTAISPSSGTTAGGTAVTITGTNFTGATGVTIDGAAATGITVVSPTSITATTPAHAAGTASVLVTTPGGTNAANSLYTYATPAPTVTAISPNSGTTAGGTAVTITGTNFTGATGVTIGGAAATSVAVVSSTSITAVTPVHAAGSVSVLVTTPGGTNAANSLYTYVTPAPTVTAINPASGTTAGGAAVTITGTNFTGATGVTIGGVAATGITVVSSTSITATTPAHAAGTASVLVTTPGGTNAANSLYTYATPVPTVTAISPSSGTTAGGAAVTITGTNFTGATGVTIGGAAATSVAVVSSTSITAVTPVHAAGSVSVLVTTPGGTNAANSLYTYVTPAPTVTAINPASGTTEGGAAVTITGTNFTGATGVTIGGVAATGITVVSPTSITATTPAHAAGTASVLLTTPGGTNAVNTLYTYITPAPTVTGISPASGTTAGGVSVTITGTNFIGTTAVTIGGAAATSVAVVSPTSITATTPAHAAGTASVLVTAPGGTNAANSLYTYVAPPPLNIAAGAPTGAQVGGSFSQANTASGGVAPYMYALASGALPVGVTLNASSGVVSGVPTTAGAFSYAIKVTDSQGAPATATASTVTGVILTAPPTATQVIPSVALTVNQAAATFTPVTGAGSGALTYSISPGLPAGLSMAAGSGAISGTPTTVSVATSYSVTVKDAMSRTAAASFTLSVLAPTVSLTTGALANGPAGAPYRQTVTASGGNAPYAYAITSGALPSGLTLDPASGVISGTPNAPGSASFTISVRDASGATATASYSLTITAPAVVAVSLHVAVVAGTSVTVDLTQGATGGPFTGARLVSLSPSSAGAAMITLGDTAAASDLVVAQLIAGGKFKLKFTASATFAGAAVATFTLSNAYGASAPATVAFTVTARPDPSKDPEVIGLVNAQADAAKRFASGQISNFNDHLEQLHGGGCLRNRWGVGVSDDRDRPQTQDQLKATRAPTPNALGSTPAYGANAAARDDRAGAGGQGQTARTADDGCSPIGDGTFAMWSGGSVNFGSMTLSPNGRSYDYTSISVSGGVDYRIDERLVAGFGIGYGSDQSRLDESGTRSNGAAYSATLYGSYHPTPQTFLDAVVGYGLMRFDSQRYLTATGGFAAGARNGGQTFGSLTLGYQYEKGGFLASPYGRLTASRSMLDGFTETGGGWADLRYGDQSVNALTGFLGLRLAYAIPTDWGKVTPRVRLEYGHDFAGNSSAALSYADSPRGPTYTLQTLGASSDYATIGLGADVNIGADLTLGAEYGTAAGQQGLQSQQLRFTLNTRF